MQRLVVSRAASSALRTQRATSFASALVRKATTPGALRRSLAPDGCRRPHPDIDLYSRPERVDDRHEAIDGKPPEVRVADAREVGRRNPACACATRTLEKPSESSVLMISAARQRLELLGIRASAPEVAENTSTAHHFQLFGLHLAGVWGSVASWPAGREAGAMTQRERSKQARRKWQRLVSEQGRSGQSVAAFCRERQLCASHFFWWKKRLGGQWRGEVCGSEAGGSGIRRRARPATGGWKWY